MSHDFDLSSLQSTTERLFSQVCEETMLAQEAQLRDSLVHHPLMTKEQIDYKLQQARQQLSQTMEKFLKQQDWLLGWGLIVDYCKNSTSSQMIQEWSLVPRTLKDLFQNDQIDYPNLQEALHLSDASMAQAYDAALKYYDAKDYTRTLSILACINFFNPGYFESWFLEGACQQQLGEWISAIYAYSMALTINPHHALPYWYTALCYFEAQEQELGQQFYQLAKTMQLPEGISIDSMESILQREPR